MVNNEFEHYTQVCGPRVGITENETLSNAQKELLLWHCKLGISMHRIQELMTPQRVEDPDGTNNIMGLIIQPKFATAEKMCSSGL